jgi:hypothetical protein
VNGLKGSVSHLSRVESAVGLLTLAIACRVEDMSSPARAFVDSGAEWSILPGDIAREVGLDVAGPGLGRTRMFTRMGVFEGHFERARLIISADDGPDLDIYITWLIAPDWYRPIVIGWTAGLDRFRWGIDSVEERFHFGRLENE